jgi:hypothetical protein
LFWKVIEKPFRFFAGAGGFFSAAFESLASEELESLAERGERRRQETRTHVSGKRLCLRSPFEGGRGMFPNLKLTD